MVGDILQNKKYEELDIFNKFIIDQFKNAKNEVINFSSYIIYLIINFLKIEKIEPQMNN